MLFRSADGLALGKGVIIAQTVDEAVDAVKSIMEDKQFGESGNRIVKEENPETLKRNIATLFEYSFSNVKYEMDKMTIVY